jgi:hypothetical protein
MQAQEGAARMTRSMLTTAVEKRTDSANIRAAVADVLRENGNRWMSVAEIAHEINRRDLGQNFVGVEVSIPKVRRQTRNYSNIFERSGWMVRLRESAHVESIVADGEGRGLGSGMRGNKLTQRGGRTRFL